MVGNVSEAGGHFDALVGTVAHGWAWCAESPGEVQEVEVFIDGVCVGAWPAGEFRVDLMDAGIGTGNHHFKIDLAAFLVEDTQRIDIRRKGSAVFLPGSPRVHQTTGTIAKPGETMAPGGEGVLAPFGPQAPSLPTARDECVNIYTVTFFDFEGGKVFPGGAERYIFDLADLLARVGRRIRVYQAGTTYWKRYVDNIEVIALPWEGGIFELSKRFAAETTPGILNIYSPFTLAAANRHRPSVGICHGVYWDEGNSHLYSDTVIRDVFSAILHLDRVVSVDANSINVIRASRPDLARRMAYIPNYVGDEFFLDRSAAKRHHLNIIYPRRLYGARGYWLAAEAFRNLLPEMPNLNVAFVGDADPRERDDVRQLMASFPRAVSWQAAFPHEMPAHYGRSDVAIIPTLHSEGTSLSALEALAAGNAVIATDVGGLSNIVIDELNGLLISPNPKELEGAIRRLATDGKLRSRLVRNGRETAWAFRKEKWERSWQTLMDAMVGAPLRTSPPPEEAKARLRIIHPRTDGIVWGIGPGASGLPKQRPQHLMLALGQLGFDVTCISDEVQTKPHRGNPGTVEVLGRGAQVYAQDAVLYIYYAYHVWALGKAGEDWLDTLDKTDRAYFDSTREVHNLAQSRVWFDLIDDPSLHDSALYRQALELFVRHADCVTTSSRLLLDKYKAVRPDILLVENACWASDFLPGHVQHEEAGTTCAVARWLTEARNHGCRIIGYIGAIADWFDFDIVERLSGRFPADQVVLIGPVSPSTRSKVERLRMQSNVTVTGQVPYEDLPAIVRTFDVGILPFTPNTITNATNPLKLYEYLSAGCPVVTTNLTEIAMILATGSLPFIRPEQDTAAFLDAVAHYLGLTAGDRMALSVAARGFAMANTWDRRAATVGHRLGTGHANAHQDAAWRHGERPPPLVSSFNALHPGRHVAVRSWITADGVRLGLAGDPPAAGDTAMCQITVFAPEDGLYKLEVCVAKRCGGGIAAGGVRHVLTLNDREVVNLDTSDDYEHARVVVVAACAAGLNVVTASIVVGTDVEERSRRRPAELDIRSISFRPVRAAAEQTIVRMVGRNARAGIKPFQIMERHAAAD